ncbi:hypothetical protein QQF64_034012 [Cirrhinus molitorella]|uniref:THAP-type domain-containing protein n=1 Tax=Cirrhinus molitorella TaxID=172907 RepID=A0ABR3MVL0_9TELE
MYDSAWFHFSSFCATFSTAVMPVNVSYVSAFIVHCFESRRMQPSSIKCMVAGIQFHLRCLDPSCLSLLENPSIRLLLNGLKREKPQGKDPRLPFSLTLLQKLITRLREGCFGSYSDLLLESVLLTLFTVFSEKLTKGWSPGAVISHGGREAPVQSLDWLPSPLALQILWIAPRTLHGSFIAHRSSYDCSFLNSSFHIEGHGEMDLKEPGRIAWFPSDTGLRRQWEVALRWEGFVATESSKLCSEHFKPDDFDMTGQIVRLRDGATPSVFNFPSHLQRIFDRLFSKRGHEYTKDPREFALTLHLHGPKAYSYLRDSLHLPLPHPHTLQRCSGCNQ